MNGRNGIMMPLGSLVTAFATVLVIGFVYHQLTPGPVTPNPAGGPGGSATAQITPLSNGNVATTTTAPPPAAPDTQAGAGTGGSGNGQVAGGGAAAGTDSDQSQDGLAIAPAGYQLHVKADVDLAKLSSWNVMLMATSKGKTVVQTPITQLGTDVTANKPIDRICLIASNPPQQPLIYMIQDKSLPPDGDKACFDGPFPPGRLDISVTKP